jgi:hypothetical protein
MKSALSTRSVPSDRSTERRAVLAALLLFALAASFLAGRTVASRAAAHAPLTGPPALARAHDAAPATSERAWATQGFRDDETSKTVGPSPDCNEP